MCNKDKTPLWRRLLCGAAVCMGFTLTALSASYGSVCILGDEGCIGDPTYTMTPPPPTCNDALYVDCTSTTEIQNHINNGETCHEVEGCPGKCTCNPVDCQALGYTLPGTNDATKWPDGYRITLPNGTEANNTTDYNCEICTIGNKKRLQNGKYYWKCTSKVICTSSEDTQYAIPKGKKAADVEKTQKQICENNGKVFIVGETRNNNYVCGHCDVDPVLCPNGVPEYEIPSGCYYPCRATNETFRQGNEIKRCCYFDPMPGWNQSGEIRPQQLDGFHQTKWDDTCYAPAIEEVAADGSTCYKQFVKNSDCETRHGCKVKDNAEDNEDYQDTAFHYADYMTNIVNARATGDSARIYEAQLALYQNGKHDCSGFVWNDRLGNPRREQEKCSCAIKPCPEGSALASQRPLTERVNGVEQNICYENDNFVAWSGTDVCINSRRKSRDCDEGWAFDVETCQCVPLDCPEGWDAYSHFWMDTEQQLADGSIVKQQVKLYNYDSNGNQYFLDGVEQCGNAASPILTTGNKSKGWIYTNTDENGRTHIKAIKKADGTWDMTHLCGKCTRKSCAEGHQTKTKCGEIAALPDYERRQKAVANEYSGDEQCYICDICWNVDDARNACHDEIVEQKLITCVSESGNRYGNDPTPVCVCDEAEYYRSCYEVVPNPNCTIIGDDKAGCTQYLVQNRYNANGFYMYDRTERYVKYSTYDNGYYVAKGKCQYTNNSAHPGYQVVYVAGCTDSSTCDGHGPAWNAEKGQAMVTCDGYYEYGVMDEGRSPVTCGGRTWYDSCATDSCDYDVSECSDDGYHETTTESTSSSYYYSPEYGRLYSSSGDGYYYSKRKCAYSHLDYEEWFYDSCTTASDCNGEPGPGYDKIRYETGMNCQGTKYTCGDYYNGYIYFYDKTYNGDDNCKTISGSDAGSMGGGTSGNTWSVCSSSQYCDGNTWEYEGPDGDKTTYCDNCVDDTCLSTTSFSESGCLSTILTTSKSPSWGSDPYYNDGCSGTGYSGCSYYGSGHYVVKEICESHDKKIRKYAVATCNTDTDCSGAEGPAKGKKTCSYGGSGYVSCGHESYYDECDDAPDDEPDYPSYNCSSGDTGWTYGERSTSSTAPEGMYESTTCEETDGTTYHYYVYCNSESASNAPAAGMMECNGDVKSGAGSVSCGDKTYTNYGDCVYTCSVEYSQSDCNDMGGSWTVGSGGCANMSPPAGTCTIQGICYRSPGIQCGN